jgi:hypothetical protein
VNRRHLIKAALMLALINTLPAVLPTMLPASLSTTVHAHQQKAAITRVVFNERTGTLEVMHRFYLHDAEHAVRQLIDSDADIIGNEQTRAQFAEYVQQQFTLKSPSGEALVLSPVGHEIDGNFFWVYQERTLPANVTSLQVIHNALREVWPDQINTVNFERGVSVTTLTFQGSDEQLSVLLD